MNKELELKLVEKYPKILRDYGGDKMKTCMSWGMEHQNGWFDLLDQTMQKIQYLCDLFSEQNDNETLFVADQIKEKMGTLRFYYSIEGASELQKDILDAIVQKAEQNSAHICEVTGEYGHLCRRGAWYKTLCMEQAFELGYVPTNPEIQKWWEEKREKEKEKEKQNV
jgi:hypothetical protein